MILLAYGLAVSLLLRYVLCWRGEKKQYGQFLALWAGVVGLYVYLGQVDQLRPPTDLKSSLASKCEHSPGSCLLRARLALADGDYQGVNDFVDRGLLHDKESTDLLQIRLIAGLMQFGVVDEFDQAATAWLLEYPDDVWVRQTYAEKLLQANDKDMALAHYQMLYEQLAKNPAMKTRVGDIITLLQQR